MYMSVQHIILKFILVIWAVYLLQSFNDCKELPLAIVVFHYSFESAQNKSFFGKIYLKNSCRIPTKLAFFFQEYMDVSENSPEIWLFICTLSEALYR